MLSESGSAGRFGCLGIAINRDRKFPAQHFQPADVITMFVGEEHAIEPPRSEVALLEPDDDLPCAQATIDQDPAMIG